MKEEREKEGKKGYEVGGREMGEISWNMGNG